MRRPGTYLLVLCWVVWVLLLFVAPLAAQNSINVSVDNVDDQAFPQVNLFVSVTDGQGRSIQNLTPENFAIAESDNQSVTIDGVDHVPAAERPVRVVLAMDISGSIEEGLEQTKAAALQFVEELEDKDQIALLYFGNEARLIEGFTTDHGKVINQINQINPEMLEEYTALYNGAVMSIRTAYDGNGGRPVVVLMTDGAQTQEGERSLDVGDVMDESSDKQVPVYVIGVQSPQLDEEDLRLMATNGSYYPVEDTAQLTAAYDMASQDLRQQYKISFTSQLPPDNRQHSMTLTVNVPERGSQTAPFSVVAHMPPPTPESVLEVSLKEPPERLPFDEPFELETVITTTETITTIEVFYGDTSVVREEGLNLPPGPDGTVSWISEWTPDAEMFETGEDELRIVVNDVAGFVVEERYDVTLGQGIPIWVWIAIVALLVLIGAIIAAVWMKQNSYDDPQPYAAPPPPAPWPSTSFSADTPAPQPPSTVTAAAPGYGAASPGMPPPVAANQPQRGKGSRMASTLKGTEVADDPPDAPRAMLVVHRGKTNRENITLTVNQVVLIGRDSKADLVLDDSQVSAQHARVRFQENGFMINDLGSTNGTTVNGQRITKVRMQDDDQIEIGNVLLVFKQLAK